MADEAKEYVKAAQQAELQGDKPKAAELLMKAAVIYREGGNSSRALRMLRAARALDGTRKDLIEELRRAEWIPDDALARAISGDDETQQALEALDEAATKIVPGPQLVERGPTRADPALAAWCSFCCKPKGEVGDLIAGPAGSFICQGCALEARRLLGDPSPAEGAGAKPSSKSASASSATPIEPLGQKAALELLDAAFRVSARLVLLLGAEGTGKSTVLADLERRGFGRLVRSAAELGTSWDGQRVLFDVDPISEADAHKLSSFLSEGEDRQLVLAVRGQAPVPSLVLKSEGLSVPVHGAQELMEAAQGRLPRSLAEKVQWVVQLAALEPSTLTQIARRLLERRAADLDLSDDLVQALSAQAARSGRNGAELESLLERLPPGSWSLSADAPKKSRGGRKKKALAGSAERE